MQTSDLKINSILSVSEINAANFTKGIVGSLGSDDMSSLKGLDKALAITQQEVIRAGVSGIMNGQDLGSMIKAAAMNAALANVQNKIGDLGVAHGIGGTLQDGGFAKTALHAAAGGAFSAASGGSFTSGMIGGAVSEQVSAHLALNDPAASQKIALVAQTASALAGGDASAMADASQVATSGHEYNNGMALALPAAEGIAALEAAGVSVVGGGVLVGVKKAVDGAIDNVTNAALQGSVNLALKIMGPVSSSGSSSSKLQSKESSTGSGGNPDPGKGGGGNNNLAKAAATTTAAKTVSSKGKNVVQNGGNGGKNVAASKDQHWNIRPGQEWKNKVVGKGQKTGTDGHDVASYRHARNVAKREDVTEVYLNKGINKVTGSKPKTYKANTRADVTYKTKDGKVHQIEVKSKTDHARDLEDRMKITRDKLPKQMQGETDVVEITKAKK